MSEPHLSEICIVALAEAFRGDGETLSHTVTTGVTMTHCQPRGISG